MKKFIILNLAIFLLGSSVALAKECSYCGQLEELKSAFAKIKPDPMDEKTIDQQDGLLAKTEALIKKISEKSPEKKDLERIVGLLAVAVPFDYSERMGQELYSTYKPYIERLYAEVRRQEKAKILTKAQSKEIIINIAMGEEIVKKGTDKQND